MKVFICGITGSQGSALARLLLPSTPVVGLTRNPSSASAAALTSLGAELLPGSYDDASALASALAGCTALFLNPMPSVTDPAAERRDGLTLLAAAKATGTVTRVVYSTALSVDAPEKLPNYDPEAYIAKMLSQKRFLEGAVRDSGIPHWTILRPGNFMTNYVGEPALTRQKDLVFEGVSATAFARDTKLPMVDTATIGAFARAALLDADNKFDKQEIGLADELLTFDELLAKLGAAAGRTLTARYLTDGEVEAQKMLNPMIGAQVMMRGLAQFVDVDAVKSWGVPLSSFDKFLEREAALVKETYDVKNKTA